MTSVAKTAKTGTHWRRIFALTVFGVLMLAALAFANSGRAAIETPPPPSVWSDKADYAPGEQVTLSGANWAPGESVHIRVNDDAGETWRRDIDVTADASGAISDQFNLPDWFVAQYAVTATGASSGTATWSFTDSNPQTITVTPGSVSVAQGSTANYTVTLTVGGNNNACTVTFAAGGLPAGATATFGANPVTTTGANVVTSLSISTTGSTPTGSFPISVTGTNSGAGCQGPGPTSGTATLVVTSGSVNTTTLAQSKTATFGDSSVALTATVTPASGPAPSVGTVSFTVRKGATTIGTAGPAAVTSGSANANFSLSGVGADTYTIEAAYSGGTGFNASNNSAQSPAPTLTIAKASSTTTVTCPASVTYDGSPQTPCSASVTGAGGLNQSLTVDYTDNTNAGTATASASFAGDANHNSSSDSETFVINKASSTTTVTCPASVTYDGSPQTPCSASVTGAGGLNQSLTVDYTDNTNAGTATASASFAGDANHNSSSDSETFVINKASSTTTVTCPASVTYDGSPQTPCSASVTGAGGLNQSLTVDYTDNTNAGTATASASFAGDANHNSSSDSETFVIAKRSVTASITAADKAYDGTDDASITSCSLEAEDGNHGVVSPDDVDCSAANGHFADADAGVGKNVTADVELIGADKANYQLTSASASTTATIFKRSVTASITAADKTYDGTDDASITSCSLEAEDGNHGVVSPDDVDCSATNGHFGNKNVGNGKTVAADVELIGADKANYQLTSPSAMTTANVSMRDLTVTATGVNKVYDGTTTASVNLSTDKVSGDNVSASYASASFAGKDVGNNKPVSVSGISISGSDAGNYNLLNTIASTTANITPRPVTASITAADKVFDNNTTATITNCSLEAQSGGHGVVTGEAVGCSATNGQFNNANVGSGKTVTANVSLTGGDSGNYQLTSPTASTTANITAWNAAGKGFYQPVGADAAHSIFTAAPGSAPTGKPASMEWNTVKGGSTVPLKFNVFAGSVEQTSLSSTFDAVPFRAVKLPACTDAGSEDLVDFTTTGSTTLRYDGTGGQWIQNWATPKVNTDTCYRAWVTFADGSSIESFFKLKR